MTCKKKKGSKRGMGGKNGGERLWVPGGWEVKKGWQWGGEGGGGALCCWVNVLGGGGLKRVWLGKGVGGGGVVQGVVRWGGGCNRWIGF